MEASAASLGSESDAAPVPAEAPLNRNAKAFTLKGEELAKARLTPTTWRLEILGEGSAKLQRPRQLQDGTTIDLPMVEDLGKRHSIKFLKAMQCLNIPQPLGQDACMRR